MVPETDQPVPGTVTIGSAISNSRQVFSGDFMGISTYKGDTMLFRIQKVFTSESALVSADLVLMAEKDFRALFGMPRTHVSDIAVTIRNPRELGTIAYKITKELPDARPVSRDEILRTYDSMFNWRGGVLIIILFVSVLSFIIFAWDKASGLAADEKKEIGILKAVGWETSDVLLMKFWEGFAISSTSFLLGILLAYVHIYFASTVLFAPVLKGWSVLYPDFRLVPHIDAFQLSTLFFLTILPYTVATIIPSWRAATIDPDLVMRSS
jgi:ABC-type lipoprotein release transport system permease subunit